MLQAISKLEAGKARAKGRSHGLVPALLLMLMGGCGFDADKSRMTGGASASVHGETGQSVPVFFSEKTERLPVGSRVKVLADAEGDPSQPRRKVVVSIQAGPWQGMAAQMYRSDLRPAD